MTVQLPGQAPHRIVAAAARIGQVLAEVAEVSPTFMGTTEKAQALRELAAVEARVAELRLRVLAVADDVADADGAVGPGPWLAHATGVPRAEAVAEHRLAVALDRRWHRTAEALRHGQASVAQAQVITRALDRLPTTGDTALPTELLAQAEQTLVAHCAEFGPRALTRLGARILEVVAPQIAEAHEARVLADLEATAAERARLSLRRQGDGTTRITGLLPDACATRLVTYLEAFANPRRHHGPDHAAPEAESTAGDPLTRLPYPRQLADAFADLLEAIDPQRLPLHGGDATTVVVTISLASLQATLGAADLYGGQLPGAGPSGVEGGVDRITASEARRLACTAAILPAVLGGASVPLDLGRSRRLFSPAQRKALLVRDRHCRAAGCEVPGTWCQAHHFDPWSRGGPTDLDHGILLCGHHHRRAHDPDYLAERLPNGDLRFHRRT